MSGIHLSREQLEQRIKQSPNYSDCCLCGTLCGTDKVDTLFGQYFLNRGLRGDLPKGSCSSTKAGCEYLKLVATCSNTHELPATNDTTDAKCKRCRDCCLCSTFCCPCYAAKGLSAIYKAQSQLRVLQGPKKQGMH